MKTPKKPSFRGRFIFLFWIVCTLTTTLSAQTNKIVKAHQINPTTIDLVFEDNQRLTFDFYSNTIFRLFQDNQGGIIRDPFAKPTAKILVEQPRKAVNDLSFDETNDAITLQTEAIEVVINKETSLFTVYNKILNKVALKTIKPIAFTAKNTSVFLQEDPTEYFFGGGVQNGRFSHKGRKIAIENQNSWTDGGVASPNPFYWSTNGYGIMWHTFKKGIYDFGFTEANTVELTHDTDYLDIFVIVGDAIVPILNGYYQLTGNPILIPKFGFYEGHLNAYNRDYWKEDDKGILFEDGKYYKESQKENGGIKESLNGEKENYQFSARAVIDRYNQHDMPLGWLLPNDGYGAGYGQDSTLNENINNLKNLAKYAHKNGVEIGLWTQSDLHPKEGVPALLQRDLVKEVRDAGVRVLKTDVAWVGAGYSFGLNGITDAAQIMSYYGNDSRPFIITLDGWAGTQRYGTIWSGDQTGGNWEYIRFHIPTYLGSGLSGQPNITSDMDGIFGGKNPAINIRDFQWKTFTPMQLNMDGWGANEKYPHALGEPATSINRNYLKLKSELLPYAYSIAHEAVDGLPMIRAMFIEEENPYTLGKNTQYQFLYGPSFLVAPIYQNTNADKDGNDIRNNIYLPEGTWIDYYNGDKYEGPCILNNFECPIWKLPVFVKAGAIIPMTNPNNNIQQIDTSHRIFEVYPNDESEFVEYNDDGISNAYERGIGSKTLIQSKLDKKGNVALAIQPTEGAYTDEATRKSTEFRVNTTSKPQRVIAKINNKRVKLTEVESFDEFNQTDNCYFYAEQPNLNRFSTPGTSFEAIQIAKNPQVLVKVEKVNTLTDQVVVEIRGYTFSPLDKYRASEGDIKAPKASVNEDNIAAYQLTPTWTNIDNADFYEILFDNQLYTTIKETKLTFDNLQPETDYKFQIRSVNKQMHSDWYGFNAKTNINPLEFAIAGIEATTSVANQGGAGIDKLFDFDESNGWHTQWSQSGIPCTIIADLNSINELDRIEYLPRDGAGNGVLLEGSLFYSLDKKNWTKVQDFIWERNDETKTIEFKDKPTARYIKLDITKGVGNYGSGKELYVFKVPNTESYLPGDINQDGLLDQNDLTSYTNYTGLRLGDADFEGYISKGDNNNNNLIDAYDISVLTTQLDGGITELPTDTIAGSIRMTSNKQNLKAGDILEVKVEAKDFKNIYGLSFALPYDTSKLEYVGLESDAMGNMLNLTNDRLHSFGVKALYPTFVNLGDQTTLDGSKPLFTIRFKVNKAHKFNLTMKDVVLVNKNLSYIEQ